jgi:hypothetical protein
MHYLGICLQGLRKTTKKVKVVGVPAEIRNGLLQNTSQKRYHLVTLPSVDLQQLRLPS